MKRPSVHSGSSSNLMFNAQSTRPVISGRMLIASNVSEVRVQGTSLEQSIFCLANRRDENKRLNIKDFVLNFPDRYVWNLESEFRE